MNQLLSNILESLAPEEVLVRADSVIYSDEHIFRRADKLAINILFKASDGYYMTRMLPWRSAGRPHHQVYADAGLVKVDKDADSKYHGRVVPEGQALTLLTTPAAFTLRIEDIAQWPYITSSTVPDMRRVIEWFDDGSVVDEPLQLPPLLLSCRQGNNTLTNSSTMKQCVPDPLTVYSGRAYYNFATYFGRGVLVVGNAMGDWYKTSLEGLINYEQGYEFNLPTVSKKIQK